MGLCFLRLINGDLRIQGTSLNLPNLTFTAGVHPHDAKSCDGNTLVVLRELAATPNCVSIGECGPLNALSFPHKHNKRLGPANWTTQQETSLPRHHQFEQQSVCFIGCCTLVFPNLLFGAYKSFRFLSYQPIFPCNFACYNCGFSTAGLDYDRMFSPRETQLEWCRKQVELAVELQMPLFLHERDRDPNKGNPLGSAADLRRILLECKVGDLEVKSMLGEGCFQIPLCIFCLRLTQRRSAFIATPATAKI